jgi:hypothetical protein
MYSVGTTGLLLCVDKDGISKRTRANRSPTVPLASCLQVRLAAGQVDSLAIFNVF